MLTKYAKKIIKKYDINTIIYIEEVLDNSLETTHYWYLYVIVNIENNIYLHCYNWKYIFGEENKKGYSDEYESILLNEINETSREDLIEIKKKFELNSSL